MSTYEWTLIATLLGGMIGIIVGLFVCFLVFFLEHKGAVCKLLGHNFKPEFYGEGWCTREHKDVR